MDRSLWGQEWLISCYAERREIFKNINTKNKTHWEEISEERQKKGVQRKESKDLMDSAKFAHNEITDLKATVIYAFSNVERLGNELTSLQEELDFWKRRSIS